MLNDIFYEKKLYIPNQKKIDDESGIVFFANLIFI